MQHLTHPLRLVLTNVLDVQIRAKSVDFYGAGANDIKLMEHPNYHGDVETFCNAVAGDIPYRIFGKAPIVTFDISADFSTDANDWKLSCIVEGHYLRALDVDMAKLGVKCKVSNSKGDHWVFKTYAQNQVVFTKRVDEPSDSDILEREAKIISDLVQFHERVKVETSKTIE